MAWAKPTTITSWSFSRYKAYDQCPFKLKMSALEKIKEPQSAPMKRGDDIHKLADAFIKGEIKKLPAELSLFQNFFKKMKALYKKRPGLIAIEETWAFRRDWTRTTWNDWAGCWLRVKLDCAYFSDNMTLSVVDHKTGKFSPEYNLEDYMLQLDLYAAAGLIIYADKGPNLRIIPRLHFLDHEIIYPEPGNEKVYTPADLPRLKKEWEKRVRPMLNDKTFAPKPNRFCYSCFFRSGNKAAGGGQCKF
jgi:hypothetical protein